MQKLKAPKLSIYSQNLISKSAKNTCSKRIWCLFGQKFVFERKKRKLISKIKIKIKSKKTYQSNYYLSKTKSSQANYNDARRGKTRLNSLRVRRRASIYNYKGFLKWILASNFPLFIHSHRHVKCQPLTTTQFSL